MPSKATNPQVDSVDVDQPRETAEMTNNDARMQEYERQEQEFLQFINQSRRSKETPPTPECKPMLSPSKGLQCLLALSKLLEKTVKVKLAEIHSEKDWEDLHELRKHAEKMGHADHKSFHTSIPVPTFYAESSHGGDDLSLTDEPKIPKLSNKQLADMEHHDHHKMKSLRVGTQMLSGTIGKVRTKLIIGRDTVRDKVFHPSSSSGSSFVHRKQKSQGLSSTSLRVPVLRSNPTCQFELSHDTLHPHAGFCQMQILTPPTPLDLGDVWLGVGPTASCESLTAASGVTNGDDSSVEGDYVGGNLVSAQVSNTQKYEKALFNRQISDIIPSIQEPVQQFDRFSSLPNNPEIMADAHKPCVDVDAANFRDKSVRGPQCQETSYEEAVHSNRFPNPSLAPAEQFQPSHETPELEERVVYQTQQQREQEYLKSLSQATVSKDFAKKFEKWVSNKSKHEPKETHSKSRHSSNQPHVKATKKKGGRRGGFNRQRSMSADRAGLLATHGNEEFEEKLRQWGIKQAHDPDYYLESQRRSRNTQRSVESPARLSRQDDLPSQRYLVARQLEQETGTPIELHRPVSIERGRRVSPSRMKRYSRTSLQQSPKGSMEAISSSSSGSIHLGNQFSPESTTGRYVTSIRSISAESLESTDESMELEDKLGNTKSPDQNRTLSMVGMPGSFDSAESISLRDFQPQNIRDSDQDQPHPSDSKEVLKTINDDINKIREKRAYRTNSSSESSLERSFQRESTPNSSPLCESKQSPNHGAIDDPPSGLPSHSICVDSGLVMEEDTFCDPKLIPQAPSLVDRIVLLDSKQERSSAMLDEGSNAQAFSDFNSNKCLSFTSNESALPTAISDLSNVQVSHQPECSSTSSKNINAIVSASRKSTNQTRPVSDNEVSLNIKSPFDAKCEEEVFEATNQPLEPLLSSQSVSLKTKLQRLSTLYDCDDGEDLKLKQEEPSGPYDVFKPPKKYIHSRSRSDDGVLNDLSADPDYSAKIKRRSSEEVMTAQTKKTQSNSSTPRPNSPMKQVSPIILRRNLRSPVPVHDLVHRFDSRTAETLSPLISPVPTSNGAPQMAKITERLLQQNKSSKTQRYTIDLSRHVREIPKEGAVQRARSIFLDMQKT